LIDTVSNKGIQSNADWFKNWEETGLLVFDDKNKDGLIQFVADKDKNELMVDNDIVSWLNQKLATFMLGNSPG